MASFLRQLVRRRSLIQGPHCTALQSVHFLASDSQSLMETAANAGYEPKLPDAAVYIDDGFGDVKRCLLLSLTTENSFNL